MSEAVHISTMPSSGAEQVAHLLPATAPAPEPARLISFWKGLFFYWLVPGRLGPHLAAGSFKRAFAAHAISVLAALSVAGYIFLVEFTRSSGNGQGLHGLREALARGVLEAAIATASTSWSWVPPLLFVGVTPVAELVLIVVAVLAMPWCAGGDSAWSVFKRSLKNVYWTTTVLTPGAVCVLVVYLIAPNGPPIDFHGFLEILFLLAVIAVALAVPFLVLRMLIVGAKRYMGEAVGPAFSPREPLCNECGYRITGLPLTGKCPECGLSARDSLPGGRRQPTEWERHEFSPRGFRELIRLQWRITWDTDFFLMLPVQSGHAAARHFWWGTYLLVLLGSLVITQILQRILQIVMVARDYGLYERGEAVAALVVAICLPFGAQAIMLFAACLWAQFRLGIRDYRVSAATCYYASPLLWPLMLIVLVSIFVLTGGMYDIVERLFWVRFLGIRMTAAELFATLMALLAAGSLLYWWLRLCRALRAVRYANV